MLPLRKVKSRRSVCLGVAILLLATTSSFGFAADNQSSNSSTNLDFANGLYARKMYSPAIAEYEKFLKANPNSPDAASAKFRYADSYYFTKDYASAIAQFEIFISDYPKDKRVPTAQFRLGTARYYRGDAAMAIRIFRYLSKTSSDPVIKSGSMFYLAKCLENKGKADKAMRIFHLLIEKNPQSEYASYAGVAIGDFYIKGANYSEALKGYKVTADNANPPSLARQAAFKVGEIYFSQKDLISAEKYYQMVFNASEEGAKDDLKIKALVGLFYCDQGNHNLDAALKRYTEQMAILQGNPAKPEIDLLMANLLAEKEKTDQALTLLDELLKNSAASEELREKAVFKKISILSSKGQKDLSLKELEAFFGVTSEKNEKALFQKAELLAEIQRYDDAIVTYQKLMKRFPDSESAPSALFQMALTYLKAGKLPEARENFMAFSKRYALDPRAELALLQAIQIDLDTKDFKTAFDGADAFIHSHAQSSILDIAYYKLGVAATALKRFSHATVVFRKILDSYPTSKLHTEAVYGAAASLENDHKIAEAIPYYEKLISESPDHGLAKDVWPRLGYLYIQNNQVDKVKKLYDDLIFHKTHIPLDTDGVFWLVQYCLDHKDYEYLNRILDALPGRFADKDLRHEVQFFKGEAAMGAKDFKKADECYTASLQASPEGAFAPHATLGLGIVHAAQGQDAEAEKYFSDVLKYDHELKVTMRARFELANLKIKQKDLEGAAKAFMLVAILYDDPKYCPSALYKAGECFRATKQFDDADKAFTELKTRYPESEWAKK